MPLPINELNPGYWVFKTDITLLSGPFATIKEVLIQINPVKMIEINLEPKRHKNFVEVHSLRVNQNKPFDSEVGKVHICRNPA